ncbi:transmembrane protein 127-like [Anneissia japonica]|uniref:transmembrane protein 127-like n=1 Tax=Anneissia japonica TaxID=1529436 RepID=UPI00142581DD|nr:transmembrane protein 127-like [Anneissia japonica]
MPSSNSNSTTPATTTTSTSSSSGRSRRHRHRRHRHHRHRRSRQIRPKITERNLVAAIMGMVVIAFLIAALAEQKWFRLHGGKCDKEYIGAYEFLTPHVEDAPSMEYCITSQVVTIMRLNIGFIFLSIISSLIAFFLDTLGPMKHIVKTIRRHSVGNIITVLFCVTICGFCYWVTTLMEVVLNNYKLAQGSKVSVSYDVGFYLVAGAGSLSVIISATNLLRRYSAFEVVPRERLMDDWDNFLEAELRGAPHFDELPPPPAYTP